MPRCRSWRLPILRGALAIVFGAVSLAYTDASLARLALVFAAYAAADGALAIAGALRQTACGIPTWCLLTRGVYGIVVGYLAFHVATVHPPGFYTLLTTWALLTGVFEMAAGVCGYQRLDGDTYQILNGTVIVVLGMVLLLIPASGLRAFFPLISLNLLMAGVLLLLVGLRTQVLRGDPRTARVEFATTNGASRNRG
jgi:uncharacterized membrane protein HdeD (DUF308 family)